MFTECEPEMHYGTVRYSRHLKFTGSCHANNHPQFDFYRFFPCVKCNNDKIGTTEQAIPISALVQGNVISNDMSTARLQWVDRAKKLAILKVEYK